VKRGLERAKVGFGGTRGLARALGGPFLVALFVLNQVHPLVEAHTLNDVGQLIEVHESKGCSGHGERAACEHVAAERSGWRPCEAFAEIAPVSSPAGALLSVIAASLPRVELDQRPGVIHRLWALAPKGSPPRW
jgi:hypothetical protein